MTNLFCLLSIRASSISHLSPRWFVAPKVGDVDANIEAADAILEKADPNDLGLLVLPELAFTGTLHCARIVLFSSSQVY